MKIKPLLFLIIILFGISACSDSKPIEIPDVDIYQSKSNKQDSVHQAVFKALRINDSLLFEKGFNHCDTSLIKRLASEDFEFYHDQSGITNSKVSFIQSIVGLCQLNYRPIRKLEKNSLEVHILRSNNEIYGAIQHGRHSFYAEEKDTPIYLTSTADFTHVWILENEQWKLRRVLSYNHQTPENE